MVPDDRKKPRSIINGCFQIVKGDVVSHNVVPSQKDAGIDDIVAVHTVGLWRVTIW